MEPNGLSSGMFSCLVENPSKQQQQQQNLQNQHNPHHLHHHSQMVSYASNHDTDTNPQPQQSIKHGYNNPFSSKTNNNNNKPQSTNMSDEDEHVFTADDSSGDKRKVSPWHRMKWTDAMVRLLIMAVYYIGDEAGTSEGTTTHDSMGKKKVAGLMLQKKGKWKSVSRAMMEKGIYVSPQQCEDKFNDLNKRYKRVNDILGKGTACRVVENQNLMDTMDLSPKLKEEVRKLLNSKHLFFREMCAYHNSCGHGSNNNITGSSSTLQHSAEVVSVTEPSQTQSQQQQQHQQQCFHSSENGVGSTMRMLKGRSGGELEDESDESDESSEYSDEEEDESTEVGSRGQVDHEDEVEVRKRIKKGGLLYVASSSTIQSLSSELKGVLQDGGKSVMEKKVWMKKRVMQLEEEQVSYHVKSFELEKQRLRWVRYSSKKERGMERDKLENERKRLENERMVLIIRQMEIELMNVQHQKQQQQQHSST
ncbi:hypothetical protein Lal_00032665 [Lupinus albus]|uniref:Putative transcription factor Trihelix family n=1 Tax=Lupinus albus TaxID=3870 RepID=A0A6A4R825_LUPAL|nr:putative transcription factor Trihelix family [Lupinus albus]KAF1897903.1 hypothetical protein Lal_00032665 [Lupinus albus]